MQTQHPLVTVRLQPHLSFASIYFLYVNAPLGMSCSPQKKPVSVLAQMPAELSGCGLKHLALEVSSLIAISFQVQLKVHYHAPIIYVIVRTVYDKGDYEDSHYNRWQWQYGYWIQWW